MAATGWFLSGSLSETRRWFVSFGAMAAVIGATDTVWMMLQRNQIQIWIAEAPELFCRREVLMRSIGTLRGAPPGTKPVVTAELGRMPVPTGWKPAVFAISARQGKQGQVGN